MLNLNKENSLFAEGFALIAGVDEAGRGPLAGPVVAAAVVLKPEFLADAAKLEKFKDIKDSKKLTAKKREEIFDIIMEEFFEVGIGVCDHATIDRINILQATFSAMKIALGNLKTKPEMLLVDGKFPIPNLSLRQEPVIDGDALIFSIAAASIIAKVTHDRLIDKLAEQYPQYGFLNHKGYGTKEHLAALKKYGPCPFHRQTFGPVKESLKK
ncbi:MAG: ribonuclease HII [Patescibacteria group bacterium]|nr:ribonuclease HII [Patescibacteria group bacterium]